MKHRTFRIAKIVSLVVLLALLLAVGSFLISVRNFSWNYVGLKYGLINEINLDDVFYQSLIHDSNRDVIVAGLTVEQLQKRFGQLRNCDTATEHQRPYEESFKDLGDHVWIGDSPGAISLKDGKGDQLILLKG